MKLTAVITNHNYGRFIVECMRTAAFYCDEVLVYDDGSTDESLDLIPRAFLAGKRDTPSGSPVWGCNKGIAHANHERIIFLDADNYLVSRPPVQAEDYVYCDIGLVDEDGTPIDRWSYPDWPRTAAQALFHFTDTATMPMPAGGVWSTAFLRSNGLKWIEWNTSRVACDFRTYVEWLQHDPTIGYRPQPCLAFRVHGAQSSVAPDKVRAMEEAYLLSRGLV